MKTKKLLLTLLAASLLVGCNNSGETNTTEITTDSTAIPQKTFKSPLAFLNSKEAYINLNFKETTVIDIEIKAGEKVLKDGDKITLGEETVFVVDGTFRCERMYCYYVTQLNNEEKEENFLITQNKFANNLETAVVEILDNINKNEKAFICFTDTLDGWDHNVDETLTEYITTGLPLINV